MTGKIGLKNSFAWKQMCFKKLLLSSGSLSGMDKIPTHNEYAKNHEIR